MRSSLLLLALLPALAHAQAPPLILTSPNPEGFGRFGQAVSGVPDADGDNRDDLLIGAVYEGDGGRAYLYSGVTGALLLTLESPSPEIGFFGSSISGVPDVDGDGRGDLLVGAWREDGGAEDAGLAYLYSGASGALLHILQSPNPGADGFFGEAVTGVEDVDGDGRGDLLVGAPGELGLDGRAHLYSGATGALLRTLTGPNPGYAAAFGSSVSGVPDANGDGVPDLLVGADSEFIGSLDYAGRAYLYSGANGVLLHTLTSPNPEFEAFFGWSVSGVPDVDGDGRGDLLSSAPFEYANTGSNGRVHLFSGATGARIRTLRSPDFSARGEFGWSVSGVPDADGDGRGDLLVGTRDEERAYLFSGATGALLRTFESPNPEDGGDFGISVSGVADANGDGRGDLLVGADREAGGAEDAGRAYLFPSGSGGAVALSASGSPTSIPPGGTVAVTVTVANNTSAPLSGDLWVVAETAGTPVLIRRIGSGTLPAGAAVTRSFALASPGATPPGVYTVAVNVGRFPNAVVASDAFDVTVAGARLAEAASAEPFVVEAVAGDVFAADAVASAPMSSSPASVVASPNPFAERTALRFALAEAGTVRLAVYDALGREVALLLDGEAAAGTHVAVFDGRGLAAGVYVWRLAAGGTVQTGRLTLLD